MLKEYKESAQLAINSVISNVNDSDLKKVVQEILGCELQNGRIHLTGIGKPSYVAAYGASLMSSTGTPAYYLDGTEAVHGSSGQVAENDVVIAISNSGETKEMIATLQVLKNNHAKIITISSNASSSMAKLSTHAITVKVVREGDDLNKPPRASILAQMMVIQELSILLQEEKQLDAQTYLKWHPAGSIGEHLSKKSGSCIY